MTSVIEAHGTRQECVGNTHNASRDSQVGDDIQMRPDPFIAPTYVPQAGPSTAPVNHQRTAAVNDQHYNYYPPIYWQHQYSNEHQWSPPTGLPNFYHPYHPYQ